MYLFHKITSSETESRIVCISHDSEDTESIIEMDYKIINLTQTMQ